MTGRREVTRRRLLIGAAAGTAVVAGGGLTACGGGEEADDTLSLAKKAGFLRLGVANERPFGYFHGRDLTGVGPELARRIAADLGVPQVAGVVTEFAGLIRGLNAGAFDVIAAGMFVTPQRCADVEFGNPFYCTRTALAVQRGNPLRLHDLGDVADRHARLGVLDGAAEADDARAAGVAAARIVPAADLQSLRDVLENGTVDAVALTSVSIRRLVADSKKDLETTAPFAVAADPRCGAFAFRPENRDLRDRFDAGLLELQRSGDAASIGRRFGLTAEEMMSAIGRSSADMCRS